MFPQAKLQFFGFIVVVAVFKKKAFVKVDHEQTNRQTDGRTDRRWRISTWTHLSFARRVDWAQNTN